MRPCRPYMLRSGTVGRQSQKDTSSRRGGFPFGAFKVQGPSGHTLKRHLGDQPERKSAGTYWPPPYCSTGVDPISPLGKGGHWPRDPAQLGRQTVVPPTVSLSFPNDAFTHSTGRPVGDSAFKISSSPSRGDKGRREGEQGTQQALNT